MSEHKQPELKHLDLLLISAVSGGAMLLIFTLVCAVSDASPLLVGLICFLLLCGIEAFAILKATRLHTAEKVCAEGSSLNTLMAEVVRNVEFPAVITTAEGKMIWANKAMLALCGAERQTDIAGRAFTEYCSTPISDVITHPSPEGLRIEIGEGVFLAKGYLMETPERDYWMTVLEERTRLEEAKRAINKEAPVIAYVVIDNLEELTQQMRTSYRTAANEVESILSDWARDMGGMLREYERDKYLIVFPRERLPECVENGFDVLDRVREIGAGDHSMPLTVSMGVCDSGESIFDREKSAASALETALQRGGDQVALKSASKIEFFGGRTKILQKRTKVRSRVIADRLIQLISDAGNVLVMGHKNPDFDSIGSCVGLARLAAGYNPNVKIVIDKNNPNFKVSTAPLLAEMPEYENVFADGTSAIDLIRSDTLLILSDVNNLAIVESPEVARNAFTTVIIDHHRKIADFENEPEITYIEPSASSASELVSEILELSSRGSAFPDGARLNRHEANIMLAGIMLDTKNFTRTTSEGTYSAALFLREAGASSEIARTFFFADMQSFVTESKLGSGVKLYRGRIAITICDGEGTPDDRIAASKTADTLLTVRQVDAAFVLLRTETSVIISARSNGKINVQLILEQLGGGGHFDSAGAQVAATDTREVLTRLREAIDQYLDKATN
ncbi:MAG: DHH family phosphoesterase [Clostridia bacterium]|nr:DHH family phosphoesterase [Clostridia bacterium]